MSDRLAARQVVLVVCPRCPDVLMAGWLAGWLYWHVPSDQPALFSLALPHTCIWIPPISAARE